MSTTAQQAGAGVEAPAPGRSPQEPARRFAGTGEITIMTLIGVALGVLLLDGVLACLPAGTRSTSVGARSQHVALIFGAVHLTLQPEAILLLLVIFASALGSFIHVATSFSTHVGRGELEPGWTSWYALRLLIGPALAIVFYFVVRAGFFNGDATTSSVSSYGIAAIAGIVGLFSRQATEKLRELFDTLFRTDTKEDEEAAPVVRAVDAHPSDSDPSFVEVVLTGEGFVRQTQVRLGTRRVTPAWVGPNALCARVKKDLLNVEGNGLLSVVAENPAPGATSTPVHVQLARPD